MILHFKISLSGVIQQVFCFVLVWVFFFCQYFFFVSRRCPQFTNPSVDIMDNSNDFICHSMPVFNRKKDWFFFPTPFTCWQECAALCWENGSCANGLPQDKPEVCVCHQFPACVCGSGKTEQEDRRRETSEVREETAAASSSASEWLSSGFVSAAALQSSHSRWVWWQTNWLAQFLMSLLCLKWVAF